MKANSYQGVLTGFSSRSRVASQICVLVLFVFLGQKLPYRYFLISELPPCHSTCYRFEARLLWLCYCHGLCNHFRVPSYRPGLLLCRKGLVGGREGSAGHRWGLESRIPLEHAQCLNSPASPTNTAHCQLLWLRSSKLRPAPPLIPRALSSSPTAAWERRLGLNSSRPAHVYLIPETWWQWSPRHQTLFSLLFSVQADFQALLACHVCFAVPSAPPLRSSGS